MLIGELEPDTGSVKLGANLVPVVIDQRRAALDPDKTPWEILADRNDHLLVRGRQMHVMSYLREYLFRDEQAPPAGAHPVGRRAQSPAAGQGAGRAVQPAGARRADQRPRCRHARSAAGGAVGLRRHRPAGQPRPRLPRPAGDVDDRDGGRRDGHRVCRRLQRLRPAARPARDAGRRHGRAQGEGRAGPRDRSAPEAGLQARARAGRAAEEDRGAARGDGSAQCSAG